MTGVNDVALGAEEVAAKEFPVAFRGFGQHEVRAFLAQVAAELAASRERERMQRERLEAAEARAASRSVTDEEIEEALGREAGRVLQAAREAAAEMRARAEEQVARLVRDASGEGSRAQQEAESLLALRTEEAERMAVEIQVQAQAAAEAELEEAKARGREMVAEAQAVRERVLKDLARRRRVAHQQLEQLRAGRERLLEAYRVVRLTVDEATRELSVAEVEARAAAETAALRAGSQPEPTIEQLEAELLGARDIGLAPARASAFALPTAAETEPAAPLEEVGVVAAPKPAATPAAEDPVVTSLPLSGPVPEEAVADAAEDGTEDATEEAAEEAAGDHGPVPGEGAAEDHGPDSEAPASSQLAEGAEGPGDSGQSPLPEAGEEAETPEVVEPAGEPDAPAGSSPATGGRNVEELFARLRAERAAAVAQAEAVLSAEPAPDVPAARKGPATSGRPAPAEVLPVPSNGSAPVPPASAGVDSPPASDDEDLLQVRDAEIEPVERSLVRALKRTLVDEQNEVLDVLRRKGGAVPLVELLPAASEHTARYLAVVAPELRTGATRGAGGDAQAPAVDDLAVSLAAEVADDLRDRLQRALETADGDLAPLVEGISSAYREWKSTRAEPLARHHVAAAHARGRFAAAPPARLRWVVDAEEGPCPDCDDNALAGAIVKGDLFPTGQPHPPAHVGCRCTLATEVG